MARRSSRFFVTTLAVLMATMIWVLYRTHTSHQISFIHAGGSGGGGAHGHIGQGMDDGGLLASLLGNNNNHGGGDGAVEAVGGKREWNKLPVKPFKHAEATSKKTSSTGSGVAANNQKINDDRHEKAGESATTAASHGSGGDDEDANVHSNVINALKDHKSNSEFDLRSPLAVQPLLPTEIMTLLNRKDSMVDLEDMSTNDACKPPIEEKESSSNTAFLKAFTRIYKYNFSNLPWMLDEGGLIGASRVGSMANADDDFDFFSLLPNQHAPCRPGSITCTKEEFPAFIHKFLMVFWNDGFCINKFSPNLETFKKKFNAFRLMYSFQLNRKPGVAPENCFIQNKPFAHMHLGMFIENGKIKTNIWAAGSTHPMDELDLDLLLPVGRCRSGLYDAPCPNNITGFLTVRNRGEYRKRSSDGSCLLVRNKWGAARKKMAVEKVRHLDKCGYNSIVDLADAFERSGYKSC